jgi:2-polyprenyl-3-methyl-5-hydroxy-6-metoxy-1,4-benzoquinol methylase
MSWDGQAYQERFDRLEASGADVHGEVELVMGWNPASVLDAGCGTGRVARELAHRGVATVGVDLDDSMLETARRLSPDLTWVHADLAALELGRQFDVVVMAGNVLLFTPPGTEAGVVAGCARHVAPGGSLITGFQLDRGYSLATYDEQCAEAGLECTQRWSTWSKDPFTGQQQYAVSVHRATGR